MNLNFNLNFNNNKFNKWEINANKELLWFGSDTYDRYNNNTNDTNNYKQLLDNNWIPNPLFTYKFNSHGFRCEEFTDTNPIMFLGCEITKGIGLPINTIFPEIIANNLNLHCVNMGVEGSSHDTAFRLCKIWIEKIKPKVLVTTFLNETRMELITSKEAIHFTNDPNDATTYLQKIYRKEFYEKWLEQPENAELNYDKTILAIKKICNNYNIKFINVSHNKIEYKNKARDLINPGIDFHTNLANNILNEIDNYGNL